MRAAFPESTHVTLLYARSTTRRSNQSAMEFGWSTWVLRLSTPTRGRRDAGRTGACRVGGTAESSPLKRFGMRRMRVGQRGLHVAHIGLRTARTSGCSRENRDCYPRVHVLVIQWLEFHTGLEPRLQYEECGQGASNHVPLPVLRIFFLRAFLLLPRLA